MPFEASLLVAFFLIVGSIVAVTAMADSRRRAAQEDDLKQAASARGWKFESLNEKGYRVNRWSGTTDGVSWVAESLKHASRGHKGNRRMHIARWHGAWTPGINGAILAMGLPKGKEHVGNIAVAQGESWVAKMAQKAAGFALDKAIDVYFGDEAGKEIDAAATHRVDAEKIPGFVVMAADKDEGSRVLSQGLEKALLDAPNDKASALSDEDRPWILLRPKAISLARMENYRDVAEIERFIRAGVALTKVFTFGRRSPF